MTAALRKLLSTLMVVVQWVLMGVHLVLRAPNFVLHVVPRLWLRHVYYRWCVLRRRVAGEDLWKEIDALIGVYPPEGHPWWERQRKAELADMPFIIPLRADMMPSPPDEA